MEKERLKQLIEKELVSEILRTLAQVLEEDLEQSSGNPGYRLKRQVTIKGLRELAEHETDW